MPVRGSGGKAPGATTRSPASSSPTFDGAFEVDRPFTVVLGPDSGEDEGGGEGEGDRGFVNVDIDSSDDRDSTGGDWFSVDFGDVRGGDDDDVLLDRDDDDVLLDRDANEHELGFGAASGDFGDLDVDLSPWAPLLGMLDSTEPEASPGDRPFTPGEGVRKAHALELRAESMLQYAERGAERTGELDHTEVGVSDDNRDVVAGRDEVEIDGMLEEHTGHGLVHVADDDEMNVGERLRIHAHLEDNVIMAGVMRDEWKGGTVVTAAMSDDMAAGTGGALGRGVAGSGDTDDMISAARTVETASETAEVESLQHPATTADNVDNLARVEIEGTGYQQVAEIYEQPLPASALSEPDGGESFHSRLGAFDGSETSGGAPVEPHRLEGNSDPNAWD